MNKMLLYTGIGGAVLLLPLLGIDTTREIPGEGGLGLSRAELLDGRPEGVPADVWRWRPLAWEVADEVQYPIDADYLLAQWWRESGGQDETPSTPEKGLPQVREIAVEDVNQNTGYTFSWPPRNDRREALAGALYDRINWGRADEVASSEAERIRATMRAHNEGPPPFNQPESDEYATDITQLYDRLKGR